MGEFLSDTDLSALVNLLGEVAVFDSDHMGKKRFLLDGLCSLVNADCWVWALMSPLSNGQPQGYTPLLHGGFDDQRITQFLKVVEHPQTGWLAATFSEELDTKGVPGTCQRQPKVADSVFVAREAMADWRAADIGPLMLSSKPLGDGKGSAIGICRKSGAALFSERECRIAQMLLTEVDWLHELGGGSDRGHAMPRLYAQQRIVLHLLLDGLDRKTIADHLGISINTVAGYCKELYRHFQVNSQAALMTRFYHGNGDDLPNRAAKWDDAGEKGGVPHRAMIGE